LIKNNIRSFIYVITVFLISTNTFAESFKTLIVDAIKEGNSSGTLDSETAKKLVPLLKSNSQMYIQIERTVEYSDQCAELSISLIQPNSREVKGKKEDLIINFKYPTCTDGSYPSYLKEKDDMRKKEEFNACRQNVEHGKIKDGVMSGSMNFNNCPKNGVVDFYYDGNCKALNPGPDADVVEFNFDKDGRVSIKMSIPVSCLDPKISNRWRAYLFEKQSPRYPKEEIGDKYINW
jgi:hypothetical protein